MGYYTDLEKISIDDYETKLKSSYLPPSRMILKDNSDERFGYFRKLGINNVRELFQLLNQKAKITELSKVSCFKGDYLTILLRELRSILPKPNKVAEFSIIPKDAIISLEKSGITNTEKLYNKAKNKADRKKLADSLNVEYQHILALTKVSDLSRIKWVGVTYAEILFHLGTDTVKKVSESDPVDLHAKINQLLKERNIKSAIGINDVRILIECAGDLPFDIEYD